MNPRYWVVVLGLLFALLVGASPFGLPFMPDAAFSDAVLSHWPAALFTRSMVYAGEFPLWRDTLLGGGPFAANPLNKTAYPPQMLVLILQPLTHLNVLLMAHIALGMLGMWMWARWAGLSEWAAALGALAYGLAPRLMGQIGAGHLDIAYAMGWWPWLMALLYRGVGLRGGVVYGLQLGLVASLIVLADVRIALYAAILAVAYTLWRSGQTRTLSRIVWGLFALLLIVGLTASVTVPLLGWGPYISRASLTLDDVGQFSVEPLGFVGLLLPAHGGGVETTVYLGVPLLILASLGLVVRPLGERLFWLGVVTFAVIWSMGTQTPIFGAMAEFGWVRWFRVPARAWLMVVMIAPFLAGYGVDVLRSASERWQATPPPKRVFWWRLGAAGLAGMLTVCGSGMLLVGGLEMPQSAGAMLIVNALVMGGVLLAVLLQRARANWVGAVLLLAVFVDVAAAGVHWVTWRSPDEWLAPYMPLANRLLEENPAYIYSPDYALPQQVAAWADLRLFYGVDPFQVTGMVAAIEAGSQVPFDGYSVILPPLNGVEDDKDILLANQGFMPDTNELARWSVSHVVVGYPLLHDDLTRVDTIDGIHIYRNEAFIDMDIDPTLPAYFDLLPTPETIDQLNRWTLWSAGMSSALFVASITLLAVLMRGRKSHHGT